MSGLAGHLMHLYEDLDLTFGDVKEIFNLLSSGKLEYTEKVDGINLFLSFSNELNEVRAARNITHLHNGGLNIFDLQNHFANRAHLIEPIKEALQSWEEACKTIRPIIRQQVFGKTADNFYNVEVVSSRAANLIKYDNESIVIHEIGHVSSKNESIDFASNLNTLRNSLKEFSNINKFQVVVEGKRQLNPIHKLNELSNLSIGFDKFLKQNNLKDRNTIKDYLTERLTSIVNNNVPNITASSVKNIVEKILGVSELRIDKILKDIPEEHKEKVKTLNKNSPAIVNMASIQLEKIIYNYSLTILEGQASFFNKNDINEVKNLKETFKNSIDAINQSGVPECVEFMNQHLSKMNGIDDINSTIEGIVFEYKGKPYKLTGSFAPVNQIMGLFKYGRGKIPPLNTLQKESAKNKIVAVFPGSFKPPHIGHYLGVKELLNTPGIDEVRIIVSAKERTDRKQTNTITAEQALKIWKVYLKNEPKIKVFISKTDSPVKDAYEELKTLNGGDTVLFAIGQKDATDDRFNEAQQWANKNKLNISVKTIQIGDKDWNKVGSSGFRNLLHEPEKENIFAYLPQHLSLSEKEEIWQIITNKTVTEMSSAGVGSVEGFSAKGNKKMKNKSTDIDDNLAIDRKKMVSEMMLREHVNHLINNVNDSISESKKKSEFLLRNQIRKLIKEAAEGSVETYDSTGINILKTTLEKVIPIIEEGYKSLTTSKDQRGSFRNHIINAIGVTLSSVDTTSSETSDWLTKVGEDTQQEEDISVKVDGKKSPSLSTDDENKFIDVQRKSKKMQKLDKKVEPFVIPGEDITGKNIAMLTYDQVEKYIIDSYSLLDDAEDKKLFYSYLLANLKLYFNRFEEEMTSSVVEPKEQV